MSRTRWRGVCLVRTSQLFEAPGIVSSIDGRGVVTAAAADYVPNSIVIRVQGIVARSTQHVVASGIVEEPVVTETALDDVVAGAAVEEVGTTVTAQPVRTLVGPDLIRAGSALDVVGAGASVDDVGAVATAHDISAIAGEDGVGTPAAEQASPAVVGRGIRLVATDELRAVRAAGVGRMAWGPDAEAGAPDAVQPDVIACTRLDRRSDRKAGG